MVKGGLITFAAGLVLALLLQDSSLGVIAFIVAATGAGITIRGLFTRMAGDAPGSKLIYWGWCLLLLGAIAFVLSPLIGGLLALIGAASLIAGHVARENKRHSGEV